MTKSQSNRGLKKIEALFFRVISEHVQSSADKMAPWAFWNPAPLLLFPCHLSGVTLSKWSKMPLYHISTSANRKRERKGPWWVYPCSLRAYHRHCHTTLPPRQRPHLATRKAGKLYLYSEKPRTEPTFIALEEGEGRY